MTRLFLPLVALAALLVCGPLAARADAPGDTDLPLKRVLLFSSGVGYFEHRTEIEGNARLELTFNVDDVNDLLKSMVVQDLGGGHVAAVTYGSRDPVSRALQSFAIDLTSNLTLAALLEQVRGEAVEVITGARVTGVIVSVETRPQRVRDQVIQVTYLNLLTTDGLKSVPFDSVQSIRLLDERLDKEMREALAILSKGRDAQKKTVTLEFLGEGKRTVRVGYVRETPVWKTSYRLVLDGDKPPFLQGWAIVENTTDQDWEGVDLTLVSGRPISYAMNLYQPLYAKRPVVEPKMPAGVRPQTYERELGVLREELERQESRSADKDAAPSRRRGRASPAASAGPKPAGRLADSLDLARGVRAAATAAELGEMFQYRIAEPVHLGRQRSAMLPILNQEVGGEKVSIYDPAVHAKHPLNGLLLVNDTDLHIMQGPVTVFDGGAYAGDALMGDMPPGATRLLSYAMDLEVEVASEGRSKPDELLSVRIVRGNLVTKHMRRRERVYVAKNSDAKERKLLIAQGLDANWKLTAPKTPFETTRNQYRFEVVLGPGKTEKLRVTEEQTLSQEIGLSNLRSDRIALYLRSRQMSSAAKEALAEVVRRKEAIDALATEIRTMERRVRDIGQEQDRIRKNMGQIDRNSEIYGRYLQKFSAQEDEIESLREKTKKAQAEIQEKNLALGTWLQGLDLD